MFLLSAGVLFVTSQFIRVVLISVICSWISCYVSSVCWSPLCNVSVHPRSPYLCVASLDHLSCPADACPYLWTCLCCTSPSTSPEICLSSLSCFSSSSLWTWTWTWISASLCPATCLGPGSSSTLTGIEICFFRMLYFLPFPRGNFGCCRLSLSR